MPGICIKITFEPGDELKKAFEKFSNAIKNDPALQASFRAAAESMKAFTAAIPVLKGPVVDGHLRRALKYEQEEIDCEIIQQPEYVGIIERTPLPSPEEFHRLFSEITEQVIASGWEEDTCRSGQGIIFRSIGRWFLPGRERRDAWLDPGLYRPGYSRGWFRVRTSKSLKEPRRFKGWKGGR